MEQISHGTCYLNINGQTPASQNGEDRPLRDLKKSKDVQRYCFFHRPPSLQQENKTVSENLGSF